MKAYGASYLISNAYSGRAPRSIEARFPTSSSISGPVWATWWRKLLVRFCGF